MTTTQTTIDDRQRVANVQAQQANTILMLVNAGFTPQSAKDAVHNDDLGRLTPSTTHPLACPGA